MVIERGGFCEHGYSGGLAERDMLGSLFELYPGEDRRAGSERVARFKKDYQALLAEFGGRHGYLTFETAMRFCREHQAEDSSLPTKPFLHELFNQITDIITEIFDVGDVPSEDLQFFSSVGTSLDIHHGIDGWIEIRHPETGNVVRVTLDVTQNPEKLLATNKANIVIVALREYPTPPSPSQKDNAREIARYKAERARFKNEVRSVAQQICNFAFQQQNRASS